MSASSAISAAAPVPAQSAAAASSAAAPGPASASIAPVDPSSLYAGPSAHRSWPGLHLVLTHSGETESLLEALRMAGPDQRAFVAPLQPLLQEGAVAPPRPAPWFTIMREPGTPWLTSRVHLIPLAAAPAGSPHLLRHCEGGAHEAQLLRQTTFVPDAAAATAAASGAAPAAAAAAALSPWDARHPREQVGTHLSERPAGTKLQWQCRLLCGCASAAGGAPALELLSCPLPGGWNVWPTHWLVRDLRSAAPGRVVAQMRWAGLQESMRASVERKAYVHIVPEYEQHVALVLAALLPFYCPNAW